MTTDSGPARKGYERVKLRTRTDSMLIGLALGLALAYWVAALMGDRSVATAMLIALAVALILRGGMELGKRGAV